MENRARSEGNLPQHEWIGLNVEVMKEDGGSGPVIQGEVVDETRNTLKVRETTSGASKTIPKQGHVFRFTLEEGDTTTRVDVVGRAVLFRPEDRVKKMAIKHTNRSKYRR